MLGAGLAVLGALGRVRHGFGSASGLGVGFWPLGWVGVGFG